MDSEIAKFKEQPKGFATKALHEGQDPDKWKSRAVIPPIIMSTTFKQESPAKHSVSKVMSVSCDGERKRANVCFNNCGLCKVQPIFRHPNEFAEKYPPTTLCWTWNLNILSHRPQTSES